MKVSELYGKIKNKEIDIQNLTIKDLISIIDYLNENIEDINNEIINKQNDIKDINVKLSELVEEYEHLLENFK